MIIRPEKDNYYLDIARVVSKRSTCLKVLIGAIIVKEGGKKGQAKNE